MEIGLLGLDQCTTLEGKKECFIAASRLQHETTARIRPRHKLAINRLSLLFNKDHDTVAVKTALDHKSLTDLPIQQRLVAPSLATGRSWEDNQNDQQRFLWEWLQRDLPERCPHEEEGGLHQEQTRRGALSVTINPVRKKRYITPLEFQERESREDSLIETFKEYLKIGYKQEG